MSIGQGAKLPTISCQLESDSILRQALHSAFNGVIFDHPVFFCTRTFINSLPVVLISPTLLPPCADQFPVNSQIHTNFNDAISVFTAITQLKDIGGEVVLEDIVNPARKTAIVSLTNEQTLELPATGTEILILSGRCRSDNFQFNSGQYLRLPAGVSLTATDENCLLFVKYHQFLNKDSGERIIDTNDSDKWLPGPAPGIKIRPLHVFDTESIMLLKWERADEFRPNLDPQGEEILVISGLLQNRDQLYKPYSWIRNPVEDWRSWHGSTGTLIYYKSGHFPRTDYPVTSDTLE